MAYEMRPNSGSLWLEPKSFEGRDGKRYEMFGGSALIDGVEYWINGKENQTKTGKRVMSLTFKVKETKQDTPSVQQESMGEIPF